MLPSYWASNARANGCSLPRSTATARSSASSREMPIGSSATTCGLPTVSVPVLSKATTATRCANSSASASLMSTPCRAATPVPTMMAAGVARPSAQGHAITSTDTALRIAVCGDVPASSHNPSVAAAIARMAGTKTALTRSTSR